MKRSLLIAALSTVAAGSAMAQSSVTIYGRLNDSLEYQKVADTTVTKVQDSASRIGFKGSEDLGGGLKANFVIESGFATDTGAAGSRFWNRESTVGISGGFGAIRLGNMPASEAYFATSDWLDMHNHGTGTSEDALYSYTVTGTLQNAIAYTTPTFGGASAAIQIGLTEGPAKPSKPLAAAFNFDQGAIHAGLGYEDKDGLKSLAVRGVYELGAFTFGGYYERNSGSSVFYGVSDYKRNNFRVAGMYTLGASEFHLNFGKAGNVGGIDNTGATQVTAAYNYNLSKRTKVYAFYTQIKNDSGASYNSEFTGVTAGAKLSSVALGLRHNF